MKAILFIIDLPRFILTVIILLIALIPDFKLFMEAFKDSGVNVNSMFTYFEENHPVLFKYIFPPEYISIPISLFIWFLIFR